MLSAYCMNCLVKRQMKAVESQRDEGKKADYMKEVLCLIGNAEKEDTAPVLLSRISSLHERYFGVPYSFEKLKTYYNQIMQEREEAIKAKILKSSDRVLAGLKFAMVGNYIDFGALRDVDEEKLNALLENAQKEPIDESVYGQFRQELEGAKSLVYLTDNCGEIVLDKLFLQELTAEYPSLNITVIVRGKPVLNDATMKDAQEVGLTQMTDVIENGTGIAGTSLNHIKKEARSRILEADVVIAKGQGNFETMCDSGVPTYYLFLCKCEWFVRQLGLKQFSGVFMRR